MQQGILNISLEEMIGNTVVASWKELMAEDASSRLHVEYHRKAPNEDVEYLKIWAADGNGGWKLVCQWFPTVVDRPAEELKFCKPFYSANFEHLLTTVLDNQKTFADLEEQTRDGLIQITSPTDNERAAALTAVQTALTDRQIREPEPLD
jgi:hypothetical protein